MYSPEIAFIVSLGASYVFMDRETPRGKIFIIQAAIVTVIMFIRLVVLTMREYPGSEISDFKFNFDILASQFILWIVYSLFGFSIVSFFIKKKQG
jgi:hypothetical protein